MDVILSFFFFGIVLSYTAILTARLKFVGVQMQKL